MPIQPHYRRGARSFVHYAVLATVLVASTVMGVRFAFADNPPHVSSSLDPDSCAMCHRGHTSASGVLTAPDVRGNSSNALIVGDISAQGGDVELCYACHGIDTLGSTHDVQAEFDSGPGHSLTPTSSAYGPKAKECGDCHDPHGSAKRADGTSYPALLRARAPGGPLVYSGNQFCATCHVARPGNEFPGLSVWEQTAHASIAAPASGTGIVCSACHAPHGSPNAPNVVTEIDPPSMAATVTVAANDRSLCEACHSAPERTWEGTSTYAASAHGSSAATVAISGEWASESSSRRVGECQVCHAPMGAPDGRGGVVPRLLAEPQPALCYRCHRAGGTAATDLQSLAYAPAAVVSAVIGYSSAASTSQFGAVHVYTRDSTASPVIEGPQQFLSGRIGALAAGDVEGVGAPQLLVARPGTSIVTLLSRSAFSGLAPQPGDCTLLAPATFMSVADILDDPDHLPELVTADGGTVRIYRWNLGSAGFSAITAATVPGTITGMATGHVLSAGRSDIVLTTNGPDALVILAQATPSSLAISGSYPTRALPRGPSVGDLNGDGRDEIAVANAGESDPTLSVYSDAGVELWSGGSSTDASATATAIGDVLPGVTLAGTSGNEVALALNSPSGASRIQVFARTAGGLAAPITHDFAEHTDANAVALGDVDGDGHQELLVGLGGTSSSSPADATPPALAIVQPDAGGTSLGGIALRSGGGAELAGQTSIVAADLGAIGPSRHPVEVASGSHVSTEVAPFAEHVTCADCHNSHAATAARPDAPAMLGALQGAWGVSLGGSAPTLDTAPTHEYQVCLKCHASYGTTNPLSGVRPVAEEFSPANASFHPVEAVSPPTNAIGQTLTAGLTAASRVDCSDCHGNAGGRGSASVGQANGPHRSPSSPLLEAPLLGASATAVNTLCYDCHRYSVYGDGSDDDQPTISSGFVDASSETRLHSLHAQRAITCAACHVSHGTSAEPYGLRDDIGWRADGSDNGGGACTNGCHASGSTYHR